MSHNHMWLTGCGREMTSIYGVFHCPPDVVQLTHLPPLPTMKNLVRLNLSHNLLSAMPLCVSESSGEPLFPYLRHLDLRSNAICAIPNCSTRLKDLEVLYLAKNKLQSLPDDFLANMPSLKILDASMNEIGKLHILDRQTSLL